MGSVEKHRRLKEIGGSVAEWFVRWTTKLATRVRSRVALGLPTGYSVLGGNLTGYCCQQYRPRLDNRGGDDSAGNKSFHPYQGGTFVDYPR